MRERFKLIALITLAAIALSGCKNQEVNQQNTPQPTVVETAETPYEASFLIFTNNTKRVFTDHKYHNQSKDVYISGENANTIKITKGGITWSDFFSTLPMKVSQDCITTGTSQTFCTNNTHSLKFFINGNYEEYALEKEIKNGDELLVSYGKEKPNDPLIANQLQQF